MSHVASLELSNELYELSGWEQDTGLAQYELGYLLRKCPAPEQSMKLVVDVVLASGKRVYYVQWKQGQVLTERHDNPEDAVTAFYIELFNQGVLTRGGDE